MRSDRAALVLACLAVACARVPAQPAEQPDLVISPTILAACEERDRFASLPDLVAAFGAQVAHRSELVANRYVTGQLDEHHVVTFQAAEAQFLLVGPEPRFLLESLRVHASGEVVDPQEWIGMPLEDFVELAGAPHRSEGDRHFYACNETDELAVEIGGGVISAVVWFPYVD